MAFNAFKDALFPKDNNGDVIDTENESYDTSDLAGSKSSTGAKMVLVEPRAYSESQQIADYLKYVLNIF